MRGYPNIPLMLKEHNTLVCLPRMPLHSDELRLDQFFEGSAPCPLEPFALQEVPSQVVHMLPSYHRYSCIDNVLIRINGKLAQVGVSIFKIQKWMGHADPSIAMEHYAHLSPDYDEDINRFPVGVTGGVEME